MRSLLGTFLIPLTQTALLRLGSILTSWNESETLQSTYLREHLLLGEASDLAKSAGGSLLELDILEALVHVECVVALNWLQFCLLSVTAHLLVLLLFLPTNN